MRATILPAIWQQSFRVGPISDLRRKSRRIAAEIINNKAVTGFIATKPGMTDFKGSIVKVHPKRARVAIATTISAVMRHAVLNRWRVLSSKAVDELELGGEVWSFKR